MHYIFKCFDFDFQKHQWVEYLYNFISSVLIIMVARYEIEPD